MKVLTRTKGLIAFLFTCLLVWGSLLPASVYGASGVFADLGQSFAKKEIEALASAGLLSGYANGAFKPERSVTRAEAAKLIAGAAKLKPNPGGAAAFADVASNAWYRGDVGAVASAGIAKGKRANRFAPEETVTREELIVFFIRALGLEQAALSYAAGNGQGGGLPPGSADTSSWARSYVALAAAIGFVKATGQEGQPANQGSKQKVDRQTAAQFAYELYTNRESYVGLASKLLEPAIDNGAVPDTEPAVAGVTGVDNTTVRVTFDAALSAADTERFRFEPELKIVGAALLPGNETVVVLTTAPQTAGTSYRLLFKEKETGFAAMGTGAVLSRSDDAAPEVQPDAAILLASGGELTNVAIRRAGTYGPSDDSGLTTVISGALTIDPGPEGEVTLRNIVAETMVVLSGDDESIELRNAEIDLLKINAVNNGGKTVRVEAGDGTRIANVEISSQAIVESAGTGELGTVTLTPAAASKTVTLLGTINTLEVNAPNSTVILGEDGSGSRFAGIAAVSGTAIYADALQVMANAASPQAVVFSLVVHASVSVQPNLNALVQSLSIVANNLTLSVSGRGTIQTLLIDSAVTGTTVGVGEGAKIDTINAQSGLTLTGNADAIANTTVQGGGSITLSNDIQGQVRVSAILKAVADINAIGEFSLYSIDQEVRARMAELSVTRAKSYGALDAEISNLGKLVTYSQTVAKLKSDVDADSAALIVPSTAEADVDLATVGPNGSAIEWTTSNGDLITTTGAVTRPAPGSGDATVTLTAKASRLGYSKTKPFKVIVPAAPAIPFVTGLVFAPAIEITEEFRQLSIEAKYSDGSTLPVAHLAQNWTSSNPAAATVSSSGLITVVNTGTTTVTATYGGFTASFEVTINRPWDLVYPLGGTIWTVPAAQAVGYSPLTGKEEAGQHTFTIPAGNTDEYLFLRFFSELDLTQTATVSGLTDSATVAKVELYANSAYLVYIHHGGLVPGTYDVKVSGLALTKDGTTKIVKPLVFKIIKE